MAKFPKLPNGMVSGLLSEAEKLSAVERLNGKKGPRECEVCGTSKWTLGDYIVSPLGVARTADGALRDAPGDPFHPSLLMFCDSCGNTKFLNALILGVDIKSGTSDE